MSSSNHTYGPTCHLARAVTFSCSGGDDDIPPLKAQFFYFSPLPIDDPLTAAPVPGATESKAMRHSPRPFSAYDNNALEEAWLSLMCEHDRSEHRKLKINMLKPSAKVQIDKHDSTTSDVSARHKKKHAKEEVINGDVSRTRAGCVACPSPSADMKSAQSAKPYKVAASASGIDVPGGEPLRRAEEDAHQGTEAHANPYDSHYDNPNQVPLDMPAPVCCSEINKDIKVEQRNNETASIRGRECCAVEQDVPIKLPITDTKKWDGESSIESRSKAKGDKKDPFRVKQQSVELAQGDAAGDASNDSQSGASSIHGVDTKLDNTLSREHKSKEHKASKMHKYSRSHRSHEKQVATDSAIQDHDHSNAALKTNTLSATGKPDTGTTGFPFQRAPTRKGGSHLRASSSSPSWENNNETGTGDHLRCDSQTSLSDKSETFRVYRCKANKNGRSLAEVPVGVSGLHLVRLPELQMMPIYWSPVHDISIAIRGTWFYKDSMCPVEPAVANQLEIGYRELRPWSQTWSDELNSAIEVGAAGEEKISHRIWPKDGSQKLDGKMRPNHPLLAADSYCAARCFHGEFAAAGFIDDSRSSEKAVETAEVTKRFPNSHVIFKDSQNAFILKPSLQPSEYFGRKPLAKIKKGITVGIHVMRGFDWKAWEKLHPSKKSVSSRRAEDIVTVAGDADSGKMVMCPACREQEERPKVTDLILVIHGIGQKLSERVESFHFTHAINAFRRSVNAELGNPIIQNVLRKDLGGIMVLPVNWRSSLTLEDRGPVKSGDKSPNAMNDFTLKDITPDTIPAVRNLISDVMLDIPFYMSHHKPKMIEALITEANRVYRLWCRNNPEFHKNGRVHIIAHSLGSAMALDVLSKQPTSPPSFSGNKKLQTKHFEFDTKNMFFAGSPAGFFLLLGNGMLTPRKGRNKPEADHDDDNSKEITGEAGTYGCLAVDNLYNIVHYNDPIAYRLNATVDPLYAASLKNAQVPSASTGWLGIIGNAMRSIASGGPQAPDLSAGQNTKLSAIRYPSQLEMEVHDFSREEIAEKKFTLLNENGQIDYFLSSGGGPLEIQYLNMLSAHSSYWGSPDFVRMLVTEVGRKPGKSNTLPNMNAVKISHK